MDPLSPSTQLLCKLGSIIIHAEEGMSPDGHAFDQQVFDAMMRDPEVVEWVKAMQKMALLPVKRQ